jgi:hypothetical protein
MKNVLQSLTLILAGLSSSQICHAQLSEGGTPPGFDKFIDSKSIPTLTMPAVDREQLLNEDAAREASGIAAPFRFGKNIPVNITPQNSGRWLTLSNGDKLWQVEIACEGAYSINFIFDEYELPEGAKLWLYNTDRTMVLGAFTHKNNQNTKVFATDLIKGDKVIIEYLEPVNVSFAGKLKLSNVTHGYIDTFNPDFLKAFGSSGSCNMNVACPDGAPWADQIRSAVMLVSGGNGFCSGAVINNVNNDGTPYVLTANHCYSNPASWVFRFNWQSATCANPGSSPIFQSLYGGTLRARRTPSDFCLVEINTPIPASYNAFWSGWDNTGTVPTSTVSIHHPSGDIKKISFDDNPAVITTAMGSETNGVWQVQWDRNTTTEGGSSGSPLYDQNQRIIGQLWGGGASCMNLNAPDYYGRFSNSWNPAGSNSTNHLKSWLDPGNTGATAINGYDPNATPPAHANDAGISQISNPATGYTSCNTSLTPSATIRNYGSANLTTAIINMKLDNNSPLTQNWSGNLVTGASSNITLPALTGLSIGTHTLKIYTTLPNGVADPNTANDTTTVSFTITSPTPTANLPVNNGFQGAFPGTGFTIENPNNNTTWSQEATVGSNSTQSARLDCFNNNTTGQSDFIHLPYLNLSSVSGSIILTFDVAYARYNAQYSDTLRVLVSSNCGTTTTVYSKGGSTLATVPDQTTAFTPSANQWRTETVNLSAFAGQNNVRISFEGRSGYGQFMYIDNINVSSNVGLDNQLETFVNVWPNPTEDDVMLSLPYQNSIYRISIYNQLGQLVGSYQHKTASDKERYTIDMHTYVSGIYFITIESDNIKTTKKIIKK